MDMSYTLTYNVQDTTTWKQNSLVLMVNKYTRVLIYQSMMKILTASQTVTRPA